MIEIEHLTKQFGMTRAVHDVSFSVRRGEIIGLLGPNGSGKTTIMRVLAGFFPPTSGVARVAGFDVAAHSLALRHKIGYLPENAVLYPDMRVRGFLQFCAAVRRLDRDRVRRRVDAVLHDCGLRDVERRLIGTLSKGYRQRLGLAQALLHEPEVLILDEPTVGLDPRQIIEIRALIGALRGRTTVLLSTHILPEVALTCDRVVILDRGSIVSEAAAQRLARGGDGDARTLVRVRGPVDEVRAVIAAVPGVERIELADSEFRGGADAAHGFLVDASAGETVRCAIAAVVVGRNWGLVEMRPMALDLENLFVRVVKGQ